MRYRKNTGTRSPFRFAEPIKQQPIIQKIGNNGSFGFDNQRIGGSAIPWWETQPMITYCAANLIQ